MNVYHRTLLALMVPAPKRPVTHGSQGPERSGHTTGEGYMPEECPVHVPNWREVIRAQPDRLFYFEHRIQ